MLSKSSTIHRYLIVAIVFLVVALSRLYYVETFAVPLPYWDQWDAEGDFLLRPWIEGTLKLQELWQPHNEHRIFPTRLFSLLIFTLTGVWNNLTEARVNILLAACIPAILVWLLTRKRELFNFRWLVLLVVVAQFSLPFSFENLLIGFQSQFYFLILFTIMAVTLATYCPFHVFSICVIFLMSILSLLTMASGLLTPLTVAVVYGIQIFADHRKLKRKLLILSLLVALSMLGYFMMPQIESNQVYRARNISELANALGYILSWPVYGNQFAGIVLWLPAVVTIPLLLTRRKWEGTDLVMIGFFIWSFLQALAISYGRGQQLTEVASRYTELFSLGLIANAWFSVRFIELLSKYPIKWLAFSFVCVFTYGHMTRYGEDMHDIRRNYRLSLLQIRNVSNYMKSKNIADLQKPQFQIPYPDPVRLQQLLDNPTLQNILPPIENQKTP